MLPAFPPLEDLAPPLSQELIRDLPRHLRCAQFSASAGCPQPERSARWPCGRHHRPVISTDRPAAVPFFTEVLVCGCLQMGNPSHVVGVLNL